MKCWKNANTLPENGVQALTVGTYTLIQLDATEEEIKAGNAALSEWTVVLRYQSQVCGGSAGMKPYYEWHDVPEEIPFEELISLDGEIVGVYHKELVMLFDDESTHFQKKFIGEFITGPDRTYCAYDDYVLKRRNV